MNGRWQHRPGQTGDFDIMHHALSRLLRMVFCPEGELTARQADAIRRAFYELEYASNDQHLSFYNQLCVIDPRFAQLSNLGSGGLMDALSRIAFAVDRPIDFLRLSRDLSHKLYEIGISEDDYDIIFAALTDTIDRTQIAKADDEVHYALVRFFIILKTEMTGALRIYWVPPPC